MTYEGNFKQHMKFGMGRSVDLTNGIQYEGMWEKDLRHGKAFERYPNGNSYYGYFKIGKADGKGVYTWANREVYDGEWIKGFK